MRFTVPFAFALTSFVLNTTFSMATTLPPLTTLAEQSAWRQTGRYDEVIRLCHEFAKQYPHQVKCEKFGVTPEGRDQLALVVSESGALTPRQAKARGLPVVLAQGAIHAGECDGKDAGLYLLRELLAHRVLPGVLKQVVFVFVPVFNIDGHERFGAHNRPNQRGPEEMGWRVTAQNLNLNRDYIKAEAPEMQAMLRLLGTWDPIVYADLHVTDGADFQHDIAVMVDPRLAGPVALQKDAAALSAGVMKKLTELKHLPLPFYPDFRVEDDPSSGFEQEVSPPRFSDAYWGARNRLGVLVETHSWKNYDQRVHATIDTVAYLLEAAARDGRHWIASASEADQAAQSGAAGHDFILAYEPTGEGRLVEFKGYEYRREKSDVSGALMTAYNSTQPKTYSLPITDQVKPKVTVRAPRQGYYIPIAQAAAIETKLKLHALRYTRLAKEETADFEVFRCLEPEFDKTSYEARQRMTVKGEWTTERRTIPGGSLFVPIAQPGAGLVMQVLEPRASDSLLSWGFFNSVFEHKEYMEPYVAEQVAREMLARDPAVKTQFEKKLHDDSEFAQSPERRLEFFYRRHPSWDERFGLYPVLRR